MAGGYRERTDTYSESESSSESGTSCSDQEDAFNVNFESGTDVSNERHDFEMANIDMLLYGERHNENNPVIATNKYSRL